MKDQRNVFLYITSLRKLAGAVWYHRWMRRPSRVSDRESRPILSRLLNLVQPHRRKSKYQSSRIAVGGSGSGGIHSRTEEATALSPAYGHPPHPSTMVPAMPPIKGATGSSGVKPSPSRRASQDMSAATGPLASLGPGKGGGPLTSPKQIMATAAAARARAAPSSLSSMIGGMSLAASLTSPTAATAPPGALGNRRPSKPTNGLFDYDHSPTATQSHNHNHTDTDTSSGGTRRGTGTGTGGATSSSSSTGWGASMLASISPYKSSASKAVAAAAAATGGGYRAKTPPPQAPKTPPSASYRVVGASSSGAGGAPPAGAAAAGGGKLCCDKCDGAHETDSCPYYKKTREDHIDAKKNGWKVRAACLSSLLRTHPHLSSSVR